MAHLSGARRGGAGKLGEAARQWVETVRRAFVEFLTIPSLVIVAFLLLAAGIYLVDQNRMAASSSALWGGLFSDPQSTRDFLGVIAASIITVTSITLSLLLIAVQQGAASLTSLVFDQFLRRRSNQLYFGFFIGLALYSLLTLTSITPFHQPVYGAAVAGLMSVGALYMLIILIYTTIDQMRPVVIIKSIHDHTLRARECQRQLLHETRRAALLPHTPASTAVTAERSGFMTKIEIADIVKAAPKAGVEIVVMHSVGDYVAFGDPLAEIRSSDTFDATPLAAAIRNAIVLEAQRDLDTDPAFGIEQLATIGWTSISTAKSNPGPGLLVIWNLRDLLARWLHTDLAFEPNDDRAATPGPIVYTDNLPLQMMRGFESLAVVASESMQHQCAAQIYRTFAGLFDRLPPHLEQEAEGLLMRSLSGLGDQVLTSDLDDSLAELIGALDDAGRAHSAGRIEAARAQLAQSIGQLRSRSTRSDASA